MTVFLFWYLAILFAGIAYMPFSVLLFGKWHDRGWLFSKTLGILFGGFFLWVLNCAHILKFTSVNAWISLFVPAAAAAAVFLLQKNRGVSDLDLPVRRIVIEEIAFFLMLALWVYIIGFKPQAYGTEKFMDYGFITAMLRSDYMPFADPWYAGEAINYYYGGQYLTAYLIRLSFVRPGEGYTFMRALITAMSFFLPFALVREMLRDRLGISDNMMTARQRKNESALSRRKRKEREAAEREPVTWHIFMKPDILGGALAGFAVAFCGNFHYVIYGLILPICYKIRGIEPDYSYWFPNSTRFIGYFPETEDKTIHEFPAYSSVLGDLHAHYINILFVVLVTAIAYAWAKRVLGESMGTVLFDSSLVRQKMSQKEPSPLTHASPADRISPVLRDVLAPEILLIGFMTGLFRWTNFWDFPIYYVVCGAVIFFVNLRLYAGDGKRFWLVMLLQAAVMFVIGKLAAYPFTSTFDQISSEIGKTHSHTAIWQLAVLWWLPVSVSVTFIACRIAETHRESKGTVLFDSSSDMSMTSQKEPSPLTRAFARILAFFRSMALPDLACALFAACAMGLVWMPEVIYVKDIYIGAHYRANTMFKLTYQAFILFGIVMGYVLTRALALKKTVSADEEDGDGKARRGRILSRIAAVAGICMLLLTGGYIFRSVKDWFGDIWVRENRISSDASVFVSESFPTDYGAVSWLNRNVSGQPVILEANGDSYSDYCRVSVATGLPTVMGWYVHEWLWRNDTDAQNVRAADIETIYTGTDEEEIRALLAKYNIRYIYIGTLEREKFPEINDLLLQEIGNVVYSDGKTTYILEV